MNHFDLTGGPATFVNTQGMHEYAHAVARSKSTSDRGDVYSHVMNNAHGLTVLDAYAIAALQGIIANSESIHAGAEPSLSLFVNDPSVFDDYADHAFNMAKAMLRARKVAMGITDVPA